MKHARDDYNRIQDPLGKIAADEPVFLLRAQDKSAPETLRFWADENVRNGGELELSQLAESWAGKMEAWQGEHGSKPADGPATPASSAPSGETCAHCGRAPGDRRDECENCPAHPAAAPAAKAEPFGWYMRREKWNHNFLVLDPAEKAFHEAHGSVVLHTLHTAPVAQADDTARIELLEARLKGDMWRGFKWVTYAFDTDKTMREQLDAARTTSAAPAWIQTADHDGASCSQCGKNGAHVCGTGAAPDSARQGTNHEEKHARPAHQGAAKNEAHDAGGISSSGRDGAHQHNEHRAGQSGADGHYGSEDGRGAGLPNRGEVRATVTAPDSAPNAKDTLQKNNPAFAAHLERCSAEVETWPEWKRGMWAAPDSAERAVPAAVNRFLGWSLPKSFAPDCGISFRPLGSPNGWPLGTNLFTADEAKAMFEHCLAAAPSPAAAKEGPIAGVPASSLSREHIDRQSSAQQSKVESKWNVDQIVQACVQAGLGILECNSLILELQGEQSPEVKRLAARLAKSSWAQEPVKLPLFRHKSGNLYEKLGELLAKVGDSGWGDAVRYRSVDTGKEYVTDIARWKASFTTVDGGDK